MNKSTVCFFDKAQKNSFHVLPMKEYYIDFRVGLSEKRKCYQREFHLHIKSMQKSIVMVFTRFFAFSVFNYYKTKAESVVFGSTLVISEINTISVKN